MKTIKNYILLPKQLLMLILVCTGLFLLASCKKTEVEEFEQPTIPVAADFTPEDYVPVYPDVDAMLVSIRNITFDDDNGMVTSASTGDAKAVFKSKSGKPEDAGEVKVQNAALKLGAGNRYDYQPTSLAPEGIQLPNHLKWSISGKGEFPNMNLINTDGFPEISPLLDNPETVDRSRDFVLGLTEHIQNADSVRYTITASNGYIYADDWAANHSVTFTPQKLKVLAAGTGYVRIIVFRTVTMVINEKYIQAINQSVITKKITII